MGGSQNNRNYYQTKKSTSLPACKRNTKYIDIWHMTTAIRRLLTPSTNRKKNFIWFFSTNGSKYNVIPSTKTKSWNNEHNQNYSLKNVELLFQSTHKKNTSIQKSTSLYLKMTKTTTMNKSKLPPPPPPPDDPFK